MKEIVILGSTGSVGRQSLEVIRRLPGRYRVAGLAAGRNWRLLAEQIKQFHPRVVSLAGPEEARELAQHLDGGGRPPEIHWGEEGLRAVATCPGAAVVLSAVTGTAGLEPTVAALMAGKNIALANKETLVAAGELVMGLAKAKGVRILPVDSEHSAVWQCLSGAPPGAPDRIILTASGGPFLHEPADLSAVTVEMALAHPNWHMGRKITIDSATMMNKGLEVMEAHWLFGVALDRIQVLVHPESIVHSMVEFVDGAVLAQLGVPDMRLPIQYALSHPGRWPGPVPRLDWRRAMRLTFLPPDTRRFPCLKLASAAARTGGTMPAVLNAANEVAVQAFLDRRLGFTGIPVLVERVLDAHRAVSGASLEEILAADAWAREYAQRALDREQLPCCRRD
ncbi:1-deoxy-D-xylulose-5-phosphate reductoisomerase [Desulfotomaculum copahuensis]|uniref:1-deoxy-D-xylulose 5-phosphate reductoisomerase n=1 Tax=Desulfotomaculum copahuensis TaxID=1838280 RepID=A0A1B7LHT3_9FIRM|nr:1-deoxy-D-xylulose-5-phosphate reductoisomerase [Desulfotomaculum copahuensis]OAT85860.1 1-deoxy-D-xylulose-5-phosphate reductoisomerase [Desulfotomaculum copahuensis]